MPVQARYGYAVPFRKQIRGTLKEMVEQGRLQRVPGHPALYSIGGAVGRLAGTTDPATWQRFQDGVNSADPQVWAALYLLPLATGRYLPLQL